MTTRVPLLSGPVLVGHDGSAFADRALRYAMEWAAATGTNVRILRSWSIATAPRPATWKVGYMPPVSDFEGAVREALKRDVAHVVQDYPDVEISLETAHHKPADSLVSASAGAAVLVVGSRGLGGFRGLVLGSVAEQCVRHAACPVLVVRETNDADAEDSEGLALPED